MSLFKYIERIKNIHHFIERERTGTSEEFAQKIGISRSLLMEHLSEMREVFNAPIDYCRKRHTFYYSSFFKLNILITAEMEKVKGGKQLLLNPTPSNSAGLYSRIFKSLTFTDCL